MSYSNISSPQTSPNISEQLRQLLSERGWSAYKLSRLAGLDSGSGRRYLSGRANPSLPSLMALCDAFGITLAQFFADDASAQLTCDQRLVLSAWTRLSSTNQKLLLELMHYLDKP